MQVLILILAFFVFLYTLYKLVKDDHVFLRKNIKVEEIFDIAFVIAIIGLIFWQIINPNKSLSITFFILGSSIGLFLIGKYRKFPLGRFFDFFTLSFLTSLPIFYILNLFFLNKIDLIISLISGVIYLLLAVFFRKVLFKRIMNRTLKEGNLSIYFIIYFSVLSLSTKIVRTIIEHGNYFSLDNIVLFGMLITGLSLLFIKSND